MLFDKFNVEYNSKCERKDYLFVGKIAKYSKVSVYFCLINCIDIYNHYFQTYLCGSSIPKGFKLTSKNSEMVVKFHSNAKVTKAGFKIRVIGKLLLGPKSLRARGDIFFSAASGHRLANILVLHDVFCRPGEARGRSTNTGVTNSFIH